MSNAQLLSRVEQLTATAINTMRNPLEKTKRGQLEKAIEKARDIAELAAAEELQRLAVGDKTSANYLSEEQRARRNRLRAHARQLGDSREIGGEQGTTLLVTEIAYQHWHRMLFSRFLAENNLLMYEDGSTPLTIGDCFELAEEETGDSSNGWRFAANFAANMLPQIFRNDSPVFEIEFAPNHQKQLEQLLEGLDETTFQAQDSLGWCYQFWQTKRKAEVNASGVKIGAREISPVTQLFTEPYMVNFLLDNALGAWLANQQLSDHDYATAQSEAELRQIAAIDGVPLQYLRFVKTYTPEQEASMKEHDDKAVEMTDKPDPAGPWEPAAGKFEQWPDRLTQLKTLDPCCGSGHFLVALFLMLVPLRMQRETLTEQQAIDVVLRDNIHGLELDQRCVEIAAFALALEAWRYPNGGGYRPLPEMHLACSGLSVKAAKEEWKQLGLGKNNLSIALDWLHKEFSDAPVLGSLINPANSKAANIVNWDDLAQSLNTALEQEANNEHNSEGEQKRLEAAVAAQGLAKSATLLAGQFQWVITNVPYLASGKQDDALKAFCEQHYPAAKNDLATVFLERCLELCVEGGTASVVLPQNWLFLTSYKQFREKMLTLHDWHLLARLGPGAFDTISGEVVKAVLLSMSRGQAGHKTALLDQAGDSGVLSGLDVSELKTAEAKAAELVVDEVRTVGQAVQLENPDARVVFERNYKMLLETLASAINGMHGGDSIRFRFYFWEIMDLSLSDWTVLQNTVEEVVHFGGRNQIFFWPCDGEIHIKNKKARIQGDAGWGVNGIVVSMMSQLPCTLHSGHKFDISCSPIIPRNQKYLSAIWCYCSSPEYHDEVREIDQSLKVTNATLVKVPFDLEHWQGVAEQQYPNGLPEPYTNDPTQWIYHGHPCGSVIWHETQKQTIHGDLRQSDTVLQTAVARLLGYRWPAEQDTDMELAPQMREWVSKCSVFDNLIDDDGIVCLSAIRGEKTAQDRLENILQVAYGEQWSASVLHKLLQSVKANDLDSWLREKFFEQHCKLFQHRPFIWHIWDGLKDGFSVLVNYQKLDYKNLERLIYTYLDDWIRTQSHQQSEKVDGASERLVAAQNLKKKLERILEGEAPLDIFVRWKSLKEQAIGWNPDLNDGVRLNIRPFMLAGDVGKRDAGILRAKPNVHWKKDRGNDVQSAPWYSLGLQYDGKESDRINEHHLSLAGKTKAKQ